MNFKRTAIFISALLMLAASIVFFSDDLFSPYVSFRKAEENPGKFYQIIGKRTKESPVIHDESGFSFSLTDSENTTMQAYYSGVKPLNFEHADQVVLIGRFSAETRRFEAQKLLVKCPSKYKKENK